MKVIIYLLFLFDYKKYIRFKVLRVFACLSFLIQSLFNISSMILNIFTESHQTNYYLVQLLPMY